MKLRKFVYILAAIFVSAGLAPADEWNWHHGPPQFPDRPNHGDDWDGPAWPEDGDDWNEPEWPNFPEWPEDGDKPERPEPPEDGDNGDRPERPERPEPPEDGDDGDRPERPERPEPPEDGDDGDRPERPGGDKVFGNGDLPEFLAKFDLDDNGLLDEEERQATRADRRDRARERREEWDADGDGEISDEEREAARQALRAKIEENRRERFFEVANGDDGALNLEEFAAIGALERLAERRPEALQKIFNRLDEDGDGSVSIEEFIRHLRHRRHHCQNHPDNDGDIPERPDRPDNNGDIPERPDRPDNNGDIPERPDRPDNNGDIPERPDRPNMPDIEGEA